MKLQKCLNSNQIKLIAIVAMTADHIAWAVFPGFVLKPLPILLHIIGRLTCPIMCYCIAEGYHYTRDMRKYTARLFVFSFISHFAYVLASAEFIDWKSFIPFYYGNVFNQTSVMWSLAWGLVMLRIIHSRKIKGIGQMLLCMLICVLSFPADWSCVAALCIVVIGTNRGNFKMQMAGMMVFMSAFALVYCLSIHVVYGIIQLATALSIPVIWLYNGKRGNNPTVNRVMKWVFYIYYPLHLAVIGAVQQFAGK
ncbi:MAG: conjugal transfer protein TraX [Clostridia bacterium]|nr:conjugal transfer protein TraX [Clostridia bacterium]